MSKPHRFDSGFVLTLVVPGTVKHQFNVFGTPVDDGVLFLAGLKVKLGIIRFASIGNMQQRILRIARLNVLSHLQQVIADIGDFLWN